MRLLFGDCAIDVERRELRCGGDVVHVEPQVFDLLLYLIRHRERVVSKDDLVAAIWGGRIISESALSTRINAARRGIGDSGEQQRLIKTIPRRGFRFVADVLEKRVEDAAPDSMSPVVPGLPERPSIAVLPFANISDDPDQGYFAEGMAQDLLTSLSHIRWLTVIARGSSFSYRGRSVDPCQIGRELNVRYLLDGSVRKARGRVRILTQLIEAESGAHLWGDKFDGSLKDVFELQDRIAASVVGAIEPNLRGAEIERARRKHPDNLNAYDYYLRALPHAYVYTREGRALALEHLAEALAIDPRATRRRMAWPPGATSSAFGRNRPIRAPTLQAPSPTRRQ